MNDKINELIASPCKVPRAAFICACAELKSLTPSQRVSGKQRRRRLDWHRKNPYQRAMGAAGASTGTDATDAVETARATALRKAIRAANQRKKEIETDAQEDEWKLCDGCDKYDKFWEDHGGAVMCEDCHDSMVDLLGDAGDDI